MKNIGNCGNIREGVITVARRVWLACERKCEGKHRQFAVVLDARGNVDAFPRDTIGGRVATMPNESSNRLLVGVYTFGRQQTAPVPSQIADDIEWAQREVDV